jgi:hypothetical protein
VIEPSEQARDVLARYRGAISPSSTQREALVRAVAARLDGPGGGSGGGGIAPAPRRGVPWLAIVGVAIAIGGAAWLGLGSPAVARLQTGLAGASAIGPTVIDTPAPVPAVVARADGDAIAQARVSVSASAPTIGERSGPRPRTARPKPVAVTPADAPALVDEEVRLLREANVALKDGRDSVAAAKFEQHARRFPDGALVELREVGRALLRCRDASEADAVTTIAAFRARFPGSPHLARLERECPTAGQR